MLQRIACASAAAGLLMAGCAGPTPILTSSGAPFTAASTGLDKVFFAAERDSSATPGDTDLADDMVASGLQLVSANCREFFRSAGRNQHYILASRDGLALVTTTAIALMTLEGERARDITKVTLAGAAGASAIDVYTRNFLFNAENISAVETLTQTALKAHQATALESGPYTYPTAVDRIMEAQDICTPRRIAALAKRAIAEGDITASLDSGANQTIENIRDEQVLRQLGDYLNPPSALTMDQAAGLWWLLRASPSAAETKDAIAPKFATIPADKSPLNDNGSYKAAWPLHSNVDQTIGRFSQQSKRYFQDGIDAYRKEKAKAAKEAADAEAAANTPAATAARARSEGAPARAVRIDPRAVEPPVFVAQPGQLRSGTTARGGAIRLDVR